METWRFLTAVVISLTVSLVGVALAANFRGVTVWYVRLSLTSASVLRRVPPWRWLPDAQYDKRLARSVLLARAIGAIFVAVGVMFLVVLSVGMLSGEPMPSSR